MKDDKLEVIQLTVIADPKTRTRDDIWFTKRGMK